MVGNRVVAAVRAGVGADMDSIKTAEERLLPAAERRKAPRNLAKRVALGLPTALWRLVCGNESNAFALENFKNNT